MPVLALLWVGWGWGLCSARPLPRSGTTELHSFQELSPALQVTWGREDNLHGWDHDLPTSFGVGELGSRAKETLFEDPNQAILYLAEFTGQSVPRTWTCR